MTIRWISTARGVGVNRTGRVIMLLSLVLGSLAVICSARVSETAEFLPGSCVAAGYTGCCSNATCPGEPATCYCDASCYEYDDCCSDLELLCPNPQDYVPPHPPLYPIAMSITFHTARILWVLVANDTNDTFSVRYYREGTGTETAVTAQLSGSNSCGDVSLMEGCMMLGGLESDATYVYTVLATNRVGTSEESKRASFTTLEIARVQGVEADLLNSTSVTVSWDPLAVPTGASLLQYDLYYISQGQILPILHRTFPVYETSGEVSGLHSKREYKFWVVARISEADGSRVESAPSFLTPESTVYLPAMMLVQLRGGPFTQCNSWNSEIEREIVESFQSALLLVVSGGCDCNYAKSDILGEQLLCIAPGDALYRARVASTASYSTSQILDTLESWVHSSPQLATGPRGEGTVSLDSKCPVEINLFSEPICRLDKPPDIKPCECEDVKQPAANTGRDVSSSSDSDCVAIGVLIVSLVAELLLFLVLLMFVVVLVLCWRRRGVKARLNLGQVLPAGQQTEPNVYVQHMDPLLQSSGSCTPLRASQETTNLS